MGIKNITPELESLDKRHLVELVAEIYRKDKNVRSFLDYYFNPDESALFKKYKARVRDGFFPKRGYDLKLTIARQAINDFKKHEPSRELLVDLMLYYVECGVEFTNDYGDLNEAFYTGVEGMYHSALELMRKEGCLEKFKERTKKIMNDTKGIGWGFHDQLAYYYGEYYM
jgi:Family of unknown function (DUF6155)